MVWLWIFSAVFEVGYGFAAQAGHVGQLSDAEALSLPEYAEIGYAMMGFWSSFVRDMRFHLFLSFEVPFRPALFSQRHCWNMGRVQELCGLSTFIKAYQIKDRLSRKWMPSGTYG